METETKPTRKNNSKYSGLTLEEKATKIKELKKKYKEEHKEEAKEYGMKWREQNTNIYCIHCNKVYSNIWKHEKTPKHLSNMNKTLPDV